MALTDKTTIVFTNTGRKKKVLVSWLLSESAMFAMEANEFVIQDHMLSEKIDGETFMGRDVKPQLIMRYPYLKTVLDRPIIEEDEDEEEIQEEKEMTVDELKAKCDELGIDYDGRKRKKEYYLELIENAD